MKTYKYNSSNSSKDIQLKIRLYNELGRIRKFEKDRYIMWIE